MLQLHHNIETAKRWGWTFRRRGARGSVKTYFRDMAVSAARYVGEVKRRAAVYGEPPSRAIYERFERDAREAASIGGISFAEARQLAFTSQGRSTLQNTSRFIMQADTETSGESTAEFFTETSNRLLDPIISGNIHSDDFNLAAAIGNQNRYLMVESSV